MDCKRRKKGREEGKEVEKMDNRIRRVLRQKAGLARSVPLGVLYDKKLGLGWFSAAQCINEVVLTEGWIAMTSDTLEGRLVRHQMAIVNKERGTVYSPWLAPDRRLGRRSQWSSSVNMMERALSTLQWTMDSDVPRWGETCAAVR